MIKKPDQSENVLVGSWIMENGTMVQDAVSERIQSFIDSFLEHVSVDRNNWSALYRDPDDGSYWELTYPQSEMHGGGRLC